MNRKAWTGLLVAGLLGTCALAQDRYARDEDRRPDRDAQPADAGFWPTQRMMELFMHRIVDDMAERYHFDDEQIARTREVLNERVVTFMSEHRSEIQPLVNEFVEVQLGDEAPSVDYVSDWAQRVLPLMDEFTGVVGTITDDMREYLNDDQVVVMEGEMAAFRTGVDMAREKVSTWADGGFVAERDLPMDRRERHRRERAERKQRQAAMNAARQQVLQDAGYVAPEAVSSAKPPDAGAQPLREPEQASPQPLQQVSQQPSPVARGVEKDAWARYVEEFIQRYKFTSEQKSRAYQLLDAIRVKRDAYLQSKLPAITRMEERVKEASSDEQRKQVQKELEKLNAPVERLLEKLKKGLNKLPTREQRRDAARADAEHRVSDRAAEPAPKSSGRKPIE